MHFVLPTENNEKDVLDFYKEFEEKGECCIGFQFHNDYKKWLKQMTNRKEGKNLPEGYVKENFYLCYEDNQLVGVFSLKFELTDYLLHYGGHIGYAVRPSRRNNGLATQILKQGLTIAKDNHLKKVLAAVNEDNLASIQVILKNNGKLENELFDPYEHVVIKRFWFSL